MGAFNVVTVRMERGDGSSVEARVQFKYGHTWQLEYRVGDVLKWGGNDVGRKSAHHVVVDGVLEGPTLTPPLPEEYEVHVRDNRIAEVTAATGRFDFLHIEDTYIVLEE